MCMLICIHMLTKRTNILFDEEMWQNLTATATKQKTSVGKIIRDAVKEKYMEDKRLEKIKQAVEGIKKIRPHFKGRLDYKALINHGRKH